eukprot:CAMPEP_0172837340 /NCGR_PEP_ID=MMETSP1075-20121228/27127_1 /TAXON_ID=2916 /ORGANISM="Ceratium fusus, Strain PA161109" /LENGTH=126 /DNA_ID=CAMNT_0013680709 /DNA_START=105 /DNA_END=486 /DNA_ORIENTATION=+
MPKTRTGIASRWNDERGFGFIKPDDGGDDIFCHRSALGESRDLRLDEGDKVEYEEVYDERKGKTNAGNVVVLGGGGGGSRGGGGGGGAVATIPVTAGHDPHLGVMVAATILATVEVVAAAAGGNER